MYETSSAQFTPEDETLGVKQKEVSLTLEEKIALTGEALLLAERYEGTVISGSLSRQIAEHLDHEGRCRILDLDIASINDVDIGCLTYESYKKVKEATSRITEKGLEVESSLLLAFSAHASAEIRDIAIKKAVVDLGKEEAKVLYTTPACLLLTLVSQAVGEKTPAEKMLKRIREIQATKTFSNDDFHTLVKYDAASGKKIDIESFEIWRRMTLDNLKLSSYQNMPFSDAIRKYESLVGSIIDMSLLISRVENVDDLKNVSYESIRKEGNVEKYLKNLAGPETI